MNPLTIDRSKAIRFGGILSSNITKPYSPRLDPNIYLDSLDSYNFHLLFLEWIMQCWFYDHPELVPTQQEELSTFDINSLIPTFKENYIAGDWKRIKECSGATIDEMVLVWQMQYRQKITVLFNKGIEPPIYLPEAVTYYFVEEEALVFIFLNFINELSLQISDAAYPTLVSDGASHHVFTSVLYDFTSSILTYNDDIGENNTCFLNKWNNVLGIDSKFIGYHKLRGTRGWQIKLDDFLKVFYAVPLFHNLHDYWNLIALEFTKSKLGIK